MMSLVMGPPGLRGPRSAGRRAYGSIRAGINLGNRAMARVDCRSLVLAALCLCAALPDPAGASEAIVHSVPPAAPVGMDDAGRHFHIVALGDTPPGRHRLSYPVASGETPPPLWAAPLGNVAVDDAVLLDGALTFDLYIQGAPAWLLVGHCGVAWTPDPPRLGALPDEAAPAFAAGTPLPAAPPCPEAPGTAPGWLDRLRDQSAIAGNVERFRALDRAEDRAVLDAALRDAFGGSRPEDPTGRARSILAHVSQRLRLEPGDAPLGSMVIRAGSAYCHGMALAFVALCQRAGLPARMNALYNIGLMQSHNMAEVWIDGVWQLFDPTYGVYFSGPGNDLRRLMASGGVGGAPMQMDRPLWTGAPELAVAWRPLPDDARYGEWPFTLEAFYRACFTAADPALRSYRAAGVFPVALALGENGEAWAGRVDASLADMFPRDVAGNLARHGGAPVLGRMALGEAFFLLRISDAGPGPVAVTLHGLPGARLGGTAWAVPVAGVTAARATVEPPGVRVVLETSGDEAVALIGLEAGSLPLDAIHAVRNRPAPQARRRPRKEVRWRD